MTESTLNFDYLIFKMEKGWKKKQIPTTDEYIKRKEYELEVVKNMGFGDYFLIVADLIGWAKDRDIPMGPGRGSAAGSIICYALDITTVDPIKYNLLFERFLNPSRISMPDIDIDMSPAGRELIVDYVSKKYGSERVAHIIAFGRMNPKGAIRDCARALQVENYVDVGDSISKAISVKHKTIEDAVASSEYLQKLALKHKELFSMASRISGKCRHTSVHPAGVIITPEVITNYMPLFYGSKNKGASVVQWDMYDLEEAGFLKMDFLGLNNLAIIDRCVKRVNIDRNREGLAPLNIEDIDLDDSGALSIFNRGATTGIFQLERKYVQDFCKNMGMDTFEDVVSLNALIRPGTMDSGMTEVFINRKKGIEETEYLHESIINCLKDTYGIILFQENAIQVVQDYAGFSLAEADNLRKAIGKKIAKKMAEAREMFMEKSDEIGHPREVSEAIFGQIETAQKYSFNRSHSVCYAKIAVQTAYLKNYYTTEFMCELLNGERNGSADSKVGVYIEESRYLGIQIIPPSILTSEPDFEIRDKKSIEFGLSFVKNVSISAAQQIVNARGKYTNFTEFLFNVNMSILRAKAMESLIDVGAFDCFGDSRDELMEKYDKIKTLVTKYKSQQKRKKDGVNLRTELTIEEIKEEESMPVEVINYRDEEHSLDIEFSLTGAYLTNSPMAPFAREIREYTNSDVADLVDGMSFKDKNLCIAAMVTEVKPHIIKKGKYEGAEMAFLAISKDQRTMDCVLFAEAYEKFKDALEAGRVYLFYGDMKGRSFILNDLKMLSSI